MKIVAVLIADLDKTPIGTTSRLADDLRGVAILRRTVDRIKRCKRVEQIVVAASLLEADRVRSILAGTGAAVEAVDSPPPPYRRLVTVARKWSLDSWRGGLGGSAAFDEYTDTAVHLAIARKTEADAVVVVAPGSVLLDPKMLDAMIEHHIANADDARLTFAQAPPGLTGTIIQTGVLEELAAQNAPPGWGLAYKPDAPAIDVAFRACCYPAPQSVRHSAGRLTADTDRSIRMIERVLNRCDDPSAKQIGRLLIEDAGIIESLPREIEIELTTDDPLPDTRLRLRGHRAASRGPIAVKIVERLATELVLGNDDALVVLGGHGDPLLHPHFAAIIGSLRRAGVYGICIYTTGQSLTDDALSAIVEHQVDVAVIHVDAWKPETYVKLNGGGTGASTCGLDVVNAAVDRLIRARTEARQPAPIVIPQMTKCVENVGEMDEFFDGWIRRGGCATIAGFSDYGGRLDNLAVTDTSPPRRSACRRLWRRCMVLADGSVVACDQDAAALLGLGHIDTSSLGDIWNGQAANHLRALHQSLQSDEQSLCARCSQWHRH